MTQPDLFGATEDESLTSISDMGVDQLAELLRSALRGGRVDPDSRGIVLGFLGAVKRPKGPSEKQITLARDLLWHLRHHGNMNDKLIDVGDRFIDEEDSRALARAAAERARDWADFQ